MELIQVGETIRIDFVFIQKKKKKILTFFFFIFRQIKNI